MRFVVLRFVQRKAPGVLQRQLWIRSYGTTKKCDEEWANGFDSLGWATDWFLFGGVS